MPRHDRFLRACRRQPVDATPVWLMRQAGRYMPSYQKLRSHHSLLELIKTPDLAAQVTLQPVDAFDVDAAIIFADILQALEELGLDLEFVPQDGPVIRNPLRSRQDVDLLRQQKGRGGSDATCEAIRLVTQRLHGKVPVIGFCGAPFTLACYAIEGGTSREYPKTRQLMMRDSTTWKRLMHRLSEFLIETLACQVEAGASAIQLFDSWAGLLGPEEFSTHSLPWIQHLVAALKPLGRPIIYFSTNTAGLLSQLSDTGADVIGLDWRVDLRRAAEILGNEVAVMGNLDPFVLFSPQKNICQNTAAILDSMNGHPGHIFNLGHGVHKETSVNHVRTLVRFVHEYTQPT